MKAPCYEPYLDPHMAHDIEQHSKNDTFLHHLLTLATRTLNDNSESDEFIHLTLRRLWLMWTTQPDERAGLISGWMQRACRAKLAPMEGIV